MLREVTRTTLISPYGTGLIVVALVSSVTPTVCSSARVDNLTKKALIYNAACFWRCIVELGVMQSCSLLVDDELDMEELVVALWKNKLGSKVNRRDIVWTFLGCDMKA